MRSFASSGAALAVAFALVVPAGASAQTTSLAAGQVTGAELQAWVDADGLALGGIDLVGQCLFLAKNRGVERHPSVFCSEDSAPWVVKGEAKVVGNSWCVKYRYPNGGGTDHCEEFFKDADGKLEIRRDGKPVNRAYRLRP